MLQFINADRAYFEFNQVKGNIDSKVINQFRRYKQNHFYSKEAGGLLLGYIDQFSHGLLVELCTVPCFGDKRSRYSFYRGNGHQKKADRWWKDTNSKGTCLGVWHTHPEPIPTPSSIDNADFRKVLNASNTISPNLLSIIVGTEKIGVWVGNKNLEIQLVGYLTI